MPHDVIMPALGMAQDTGLIVSWLKAPGEAVRAGEPLMEVETDKATVEVEAQADGYLTEIRAAAGETVPVGEVVAVIGDSADAGQPPPPPRPPPRPPLLRPPPPLLRPPHRRTTCPRVSASSCRRSAWRRTRGC